MRTLDTLREQMGREGARRTIAEEEARLAERFTWVGADCLRSQIERLTELARTPEQRREAREATERFNTEARRFGLEEIV